MTTSDSINEIATALAMAQGQMGVAVKDSENPYFKSKYADLASVWDACRGPLSKNGLAIVQSPSAEGLRVMVETLLTHTSGQWMRGTISATAKDESPQSVGSAITYLRRYALQSFAAVAPEEDDAEAAQGHSRSHSEEPSTAPSAGAGKHAPAFLTSPAAPPNGATKVKDVQTKQGKSAKGPWTRFYVTFEDGRDGVTFSATLGEEARTAKADGHPVNPEIVKGEKGNDLKALYRGGGPSRPLEPVVERGPEEPVSGPEKILTARKITRGDATVYYVIQTAKREIFTADADLAQQAVAARKAGIAVVPVFGVAPWLGVNHPVNVVTKLLVEDPPEPAETVAEVMATLASESSEDVREPGDED